MFTKSIRNKMLLVVSLMYFSQSARQGLAQAPQVTATINSETPLYALLNPHLTTTLSCNVTGADSIEWLVDETPATNQIITDRGVTQSVATTIDTGERAYRRDIMIPNTYVNVRTLIVCVAVRFSAYNLNSSTVELNLVSNDTPGTTQPPATITNPTVDNTKITSESPAVSEGVKPKSLSTDAIIGIVFGGIVIIILLSVAAVIVVILLIRKKRMKRKGRKKITTPKSDHGKTGKQGCDSSTVVGNNECLDNAGV